MLELHPYDAFVRGEKNLTEKNITLLEGNSDCYFLVEVYSAEEKRGERENRKRNANRHADRPRRQNYQLIDRKSVV